MTCKDCFHFEVCDSGRHIGEYIDDDGIYSKGVEKECPAFKNKSDYEKAMEKQIPVKPNGDLHSVPHYRCRNCHNSVVTFCDDKHFPHCQWCGQALDWSDNK